MFCSALFVTLFGVEHNETVEPPMTPEQMETYQKRLAELQAEHDFQQKVTPEVPRRI